ncbi:MAG: Ca2+/Na+ antiporter [Bacillariaceae sp.]|jgi:Ca2+/Na+ antiporter
MHVLCITILLDFHYSIILYLVLIILFFVFFFLFSNFYLKQFVRETDRHIQEGQNNMKQCEIYRKQLATSKMDIMSFQKRHEDNTERLRQKDRQLVEKDRQIQQLKRMLAQNNNDTNNSGNGGRSAGSSGLSSFRPPGSSSSAPSLPSSSSVIHESHHRPFQHYVRKKEEREVSSCRF